MILYEPQHLLYTNRSIRIVLMTLAPEVSQVVRYIPALKYRLRQDPVACNISFAIRREKAIKCVGISTWLLMFEKYALPNRVADIPATMTQLGVGLLSNHFGSSFQGFQISSVLMRPSYHFGSSRIFFQYCAQGLSLTTGFY